MMNSVEKIIGKIIVFSQFRDAIREVALGQLYRSVEHRNELLSAIIDALETLEEDFDAATEQTLDDEGDSPLPPKTQGNK